MRQKQCNFEMSERMCAACGFDRCENADLKDITCFKNLCYDLAIAMNLL